MDWYVYILLCDQKTYYIGLTSNLEERLLSHKRRENMATKRYFDVKLVFQEKHPSRKLAEMREIQLKKWTKAKKKALIEGEIDLLKKLSKFRAC